MPNPLFLTVLTVLYLTLSVQSVFASNILDVRVSKEAKTTRVVFDIPEMDKFSYFSLSNPNRLVIDLKALRVSTNLDKFSFESSLLSRVRYSTPKAPSDTRLVLELTQKVSPTLFKLDASDGKTARLVVDLYDENAVSRPPAPAQSQVVMTAEDSPERDIIVAIDAGHGGRDPGSIGSGGTYEKTITLSVARMLAQRIENTEGMKAEMIRDADFYVSPNKRPEIARQRKADLFVSIHADAFHKPQPRGASVWVLSMRRADNELGRWLERTERHSELLGGAAEVITNKASERYLAETILGLSMDHSMASSYDLSELVIDNMRTITKMHKREPQAASLAVLTSPDIPSILVELGFISNPQEEKNLNWKQYRQKLATSIFDALVLYFKQTPPDGTLWAARKQTIRNHKVRSGDSLSVLAERYNTSVKKIKATNNLSSNTLRIGQVLQIPIS